MVVYEITVSYKTPVSKQGQSAILKQYFIHNLNLDDTSATLCKVHTTKVKSYNYITFRSCMAFKKRGKESYTERAHLLIYKIYFEDAPVNLSKELISSLEQLFTLFNGSVVALRVIKSNSLNIKI